MAGLPGVSWQPVEGRGAVSFGVPPGHRLDETVFRSHFDLRTEARFSPELVRRVGCNQS